MRAWPGILLVAGLAVLAAGCGGSGKKSPGVASLGPTTSTTTTTTSGGGAQSTGAPSKLGNFVRFVHCMDAHGIQAQLGQGGQGVTINGPGVGPNSPTLQAAQKACQKYLPNGGPQQLTPAQRAQDMKLLLAMAKCIRAHGIPSFPDPDSQGTFQFPQSSSFDPGSSQFQAAMQACRPSNGAKVPIAIRVGSPGGPGAGRAIVQAAQGGP
jgi:hypothetical protein